jgi:hypothetical protein
MIVFGDEEGNLYTSTNFSTVCEQIPGATIVSGSGFVTDQNSLIHFYGADKTASSGFSIKENGMRMGLWFGQTSSLWIVISLLSPHRQKEASMSLS